MSVSRQIVRIILLLVSILLALIFFGVPFGSRYSTKTARAIVEYRKSPNETTKRSLESAHAHDRNTDSIIQLASALLLSGTVIAFRHIGKSVPSTNVESGKLR